MTHTNCTIALRLCSFCVFLSQLIGGSQYSIAEESQRENIAQAAAGKHDSDPLDFPALPFETTRIKIDGECIDDDVEPIRLARIRLYRYENSFSKPELIRVITPNNQGQFEFPEIDFPVVRDEDAPRSYWLAPSYVLTATSPQRTSGWLIVRPKNDRFHATFDLDPKPESLSGRVVARGGKPVVGATIHMQHAYSIPIEGVLSSTTDEAGRYEIQGLKAWDSNGRARCAIMISHPEFGRAQRWYSAVPQTNDFVLDLPAVIEGQVFDVVQNRPAKNALVSAQGVARSGWYQTVTDGEGRYKLVVSEDHYNIWADVKDRIAIAVKSIPATPAEKTVNADIKLVRGGFVEGQGLNPGTFVANYGPARPKTGAAVNSAKVKPDGTFRLRVAPGNNYIYIMGGDGAQYLSIDDGQTIQCDWNAQGPQEIRDQFNQDNIFSSELVRQAQEEDEEQAKRRANDDIR